MSEIVQKENVGRRVLRRLQRVFAVETAELVIDGWGKVFELGDLTKGERDRLITPRLSDFHAEVDLLRASLQAAKVDPEVYSSALNSVDRALNIRIFQHHWSEVRGLIEGETIGALRALPQFLPHEAPGEADLQWLKSNVEALRAKLSEAEIPSELGFFLLEQLDLILRAIEQYRFVGSRAFRDASDTAAQMWQENRELVEPHKHTPIVEAVWNLWPGIKEWAKNAVILGKFAQLIFVDLPVILHGAQAVLLIAPSVQVEALGPLLLPSVFDVLPAKEPDEIVVELDDSELQDP